MDKRIDLEHPEIDVPLDGVDDLATREGLREQALTDPEAAATLDALLAAADEHDERIDLRETLLEHAAEPEARRKLLEELVAIHEEGIGSPPLAFVAAARAYREFSSFDATLERLAEATGSWAQLAEIYAEVETPDHRRIAALRETKLDDSAGAIASWEAVLAAEPEDREAEDALVRLYAAADRGEELLVVLRRRADRAEGEERRDLLMQAADACSLTLDDPERAVAFCREALAIDAAFAPALETLALYLREEDDREELVSVLDRLAAAQPQGSEARVVYRMRRSAILAAAGEHAGAIADLAAVLGEQPAEPRAIAALEDLLTEGVTAAAALLEPIYRSAGDNERLLAVFERRLGDASEEERATLLGEMTELRLATGDAEAAWPLALATFAHDPSDFAAREKLVELAGSTGSWDELAAAFEDAIARISSDEALPLLQVLAPIYAERLDRADAAAAAWERIAAAAPGEEPLQQLEAIYRSRGAHRELCAVLRRRAAFVEIADRKSLLVELAELEEDRLGDLGAALEVWREILAIDEADRETFSHVSRLLGETKAWDDLAALLERQVDLAAERGDADEARELRFRLARIQQQQLGDAARAVDLYRAVLAEQPRHPATLGALEELARSQDERQRALAAELLAPIYAEERDWRRHVQMLDVRASAALEPAVRAETFRAAATIYERELESPEMAFLAASRALEVEPDETTNLALVLRMAELAGDMEEELGSLLATAAEKAHSDGGRAALLRERARLLARTGDEAGARAAWDKVRAVAPDDAEALGALAQLHGRAGDVDAQLEALRSLLAREEDAQTRRDLLFDIAVLQEERKRDVAGAVATLRRILELAPLDAEALARLDALCVQQERWIDLADVLASEERAAAERGDTAQRVEFLFRLATLREGCLLDREGALALHRQILELAPDHVGTQSRLEALLGEEPGELEAIATLESAFRATGDAARLAEILEVRVEATFDAEARKAVLLEIAEIHAMRQGRHDLAFRALARAFRDFPGDRAVWAPLWREAAAGESTAEWLELQEEAVTRVEDAEELSLFVATQCEGTIRDEAAAVRWYERARGHAEALVALERLHRAAERWEPLADVLGDLAAREADPRERVNLLFRLGRLAEERLSSSERAIEAYRRLLEVDPRHLPALRAIEPLHEAAGDHRALYDVLAAQREATPEGSAWQRLALRLAEVADAGLHDAERAATHYREVLERNARHDGAHRGLESLLERTGQWEELAGLLRARLKSTLDPREAASLNERLGRLQAEHLGDAEAAIASYTAVLDRDPRHRRSLEALRTIHGARGDAESLAAVLRRLVPLQDDAQGVKAIRLELAETLAAAGRREEAIENGKRVLDIEPHDLAQLQRIELLFRDLSAWGEVVRTMELQAPLLDAADEESAVDLWRSVARIQEEHLHRREGAAAALEKILERRPDAEAFEKLRAIYRSVADWRRYAQATERFAAGCAELERKVALLAEVAEVHETRLGQREFAFARLGAAFELQPTSEALRTRLATLADEGGLHEELALIYESVADVWESEPIAVTLLLELGALQDEKLGDADAAEESFRRILELDASNGGALDALGALFERHGNHVALIEVLEKQLGVAIEIDARRELLHRIARVQHEQLGAREDAIASLERAFELDPTAEATREALAALYRDASRLQDLAGLFARARDLAIDEGLRYALQRRLAVLLESDLGDDAAAISAWSLAHELDPSQAEPLDALERLDTRHDRWAELLRVYGRKLAIASSDDERCKLRLKEASIHEEKLGNLAAATDALEAAREAMPEHRVVLQELARLLRAQSAWERLVVVTQELVDVLAGDPNETAERADLLVKLGDVRLRELDDAAGAELAWRDALSLEPRARRALGGLATIYERWGNWTDALRMLTAEAELIGPVLEARELHVRIGRIQAAELGDRAAAEQAFRAALAIDPGYLPALRELRAVQQARGDREAYLESLTQEAIHTDGPAEKSRLWNEVGHAQSERGDEDAAIHAFEEARRYTPGDLGAARALADRYFVREDWERAEPALDVICAAAPGGDADALRAHARELYRLGAVCERLDKTPKALQAYGRSWELDPSGLAAGEGFARLLVRTGDDAQALRVYQAILIHHREELSDPEVVEIHFAIGEIRRRLGEIEAALKSFRSALELDSWHVDSHRAVIALAEASGDLSLALEHRQKLGHILEGDEKHAMLVETAALAATRLDDPWGAIDAYVTALRLKPDDVGTAEKLLDLYKQTKQAAKAVDLLRRLLAQPAVQADPRLRIRCHLRLGEHYREEAATDPGALAVAVEQYNAALDLDWRKIEAFQAIEALLGERQEWRLLEANYVRMLQRLPREEATRAARVLFYRSLGELYRNALQDFAAAAEAFKAVTLLAPDDGDAATAWAELVDRKPGAELEAITAWRKALPVAKDVVPIAHALERLHAKRRSYDAAFVAASVVEDLFGKGGSDEAGILARLRPFAKTQATGAIGEKQLVDVLAHDGIRGPIAQLFAIIHTHAGSLLAGEFDAVPVDGGTLRIDRKRDRVDPALYLAGALTRAAANFGVAAPELYKVQGATGITVVNTWPACVVAGEEMFAQQGSRRQLAFVLGRNLAFTRPELALARFHKEPQLEILLQAAVLVGEPRFKRTADEAQVTRLRKKLLKVLPPEAVHGLQKIAYAFARDRNRQTVRAYLEAAEHTADRAGALLCGDLSVARHQLAAQKGDAADLPLEQRLRDVAGFALTDAWSDLRKALGLSVQIPT